MNKTVLIKLLIFMLAFIMLLSASGCGKPAESKKDDSLQKVLDKGELVLGLDTDFPPLGFIDESGNIAGFDIDVAEEVCKRLSVTLVKKGIDWDEKDDELNSGKIDCIWNGFTITDERSKTINFSDPYMKNELIFIVTGDSDIKAVRELKGKKVGVQSGSTAEDVLKKSDIYPDITMITYDTALLAMEKLDQKEVDTALVDSVVAYYILSDNGTRHFILPDSLSEEEYGIGFRKDDQALRDKVQTIISEMKADGTLGKISKKWFGSDITTVK